MHLIFAAALLGTALISVISPQADTVAAGTFNVRDYGALGNGVHDDTDAIADALAAAKLAGSGTVLVPAGTYMVRGGDKVPPLDLSAGSSIVGDGPSLSILKLIPASVNPAWTDIRMLRPRNNTRVAGLTFDGSKSDFNRGAFSTPIGSYLLRTNPNTHDVVMENLVVRDTFAIDKEGFGLSVGRGYDITIQNVEVYGVEGSGISISGDWWGVRSHDITINNVKAHHNTFNGITFFGAERTTLTGVTAWENGAGLNLEWTDAITIGNSETYNNADAGVRVLGYSTGVLLRNFYTHDNTTTEVTLSWNPWPVKNPDTGRIESGIVQDVTFDGCRIVPANGLSHFRINPNAVETTIGAVVPQSIVLGCTTADSFRFSYEDEPWVPRVDVELYSEARYGVKLTTQVPVPGNTTPMANAGDDQTVNDSGDDGVESVTLDGRRSSDPDGSIVSHVWYEAGAKLGTGDQLTIPLAVGTHTLTLRVTDNQGTMASDQVAVTVADANPPTVQASRNPVGNKGWATVDTTVSISATEPGGAGRVQSITYTASGAQTVGETTVPGHVASLVITQSGQTTVRYWATDIAGNKSAAKSITVKIDRTGPLMTGPVPEFDTATKRMGTADQLPIRFRWTGSDALSGIARFEAQVKTAAGAFANMYVIPRTATTAKSTLAIGKTHRARVRGLDVAGNYSRFRGSATFELAGYQESDSSVTYTGSWTTRTQSTAWDGNLSYATANGARATFVFKGRQVAWISGKGPNRGMAQIWLDGTYVKTVNLYSATGVVRPIVFTSEQLTPWVKHTLEIRVLGKKHASSTDTRVDIDGFVVLDDRTP